jgi:hypothetical protein
MTEPDVRFQLFEIYVPDFVMVLVIQRAYTKITPTRNGEE